MFRKINTAPEAVTIEIDGLAVEAEAGESVAAVLLRIPPYLARTTPVGLAPRAPHCMMGVCFDCLVTIEDEVSVQSCLVPVRNGMKIARQNGKRQVA